MYDLPQFSQEVPVAAQAKSKITPTTRLMWPELQDDHLENSRKVPLDRHDIIIDKLAVSHDSNQVVAVTSNNMVSNNESLLDNVPEPTTYLVGHVIQKRRHEFQFFFKTVSFMCLECRKLSVFLQRSKPLEIQVQMFSVTFFFQVCIWKNVSAETGNSTD